MISYFIAIVLVNIRKGNNNTNIDFHMHNNIMFGNNSRTTNGSICEKTIKNLTLTMFIKCISFQKFLLKKFAHIHFICTTFIFKILYLSNYFISKVIKFSISVFPTPLILWLFSKNCGSKKSIKMKIGLLATLPARIEFLILIMPQLHFSDHVRLRRYIIS